MIGRPTPALSEVYRNSQKSDWFFFFSFERLFSFLFPVACVSGLLISVCFCCLCQLHPNNFWLFVLLGSRSFRTCLHCHALIFRWTGSTRETSKYVIASIHSVTCLFRWAIGADFWFLFSFFSARSVWGEEFDWRAFWRRYQNQIDLGSGNEGSLAIVEEISYDTLPSY